MNKLSLVAFSLSLLISGCGTPSKEVRPISTSEHTRSMSQQLRIFKVLSRDPGTGGEISNSVILSALIQSALSSTGYKQQYSFYNNGRYTQGVKIESNKNGFSIYYVDDYESLKRNASGMFKVEIENSGETKNVVVSCPTEIAVFDSFKTGFMDGKRWYTEESVSADLSKICKYLGVTIQSAKYVRGELNTEYPSESVFANYTRKYKTLNVSGDSVKGYDIEKAKYFNIGDARREIGAAISVFPYRKGSKVLYGFKFPYEILGDGTTTYRAEKISELEKVLAAVAND